MRYLLFVSLMLVWASCAPKPYKNLKSIPWSAEGMSPLAVDYQPQFDKVLYNCRVDGKNPFGKKYSLSGLLFFKKMEYGGTRVVFQNQMGITYFDFGWDNVNQFTVHQIMDQMNKPALIKTLKKDFELLLFKNLPAKSSGLFTTHPFATDYLRFELEKGFAFYIFENQKIVGIENADAKRKVVLFDLIGADGYNTLAPKITIKHLRANFNIEMSQLNQNSTEDATSEE